MTNSILYVLYYNEETKTRAMREYSSNLICRFLYVPTSVYFESFVIIELLIQKIDEWKSCDYVGVISYKARDKCFIPEDFSQLDSAKKEDYQIIHFYNAPSKEFYFENAYIAHKNLKKIITILSEVIPINFQKIVPMWSNYWFMTPTVLYKYILFLRHVKTIFESNSELKCLLYDDAGWAHPPRTFIEATGLRHYPHHPFVMERMTGVFAGDFKTASYSSLT
jgi:hypothetical protein